jgi:hypothetical protein
MIQLKPAPSKEQERNRATEWEREKGGGEGEGGGALFSLIIFIRSREYAAETEMLHWQLSIAD